MTNVLFEMTLDTKYDEFVSSHKYTPSFNDKQNKSLYYEFGEKFYCLWSSNYRSDSKVKMGMSNCINYIAYQITKNKVNPKVFYNDFRIYNIRKHNPMFKLEREDDRELFKVFMELAKPLERLVTYDFDMLDDRLSKSTEQNIINGNDHPFLYYVGDYFAKLLYFSGKLDCFVDDINEKDPENPSFLYKQLLDALNDVLEIFSAKIEMTCGFVKPLGRKMVCSGIRY